MTGVTKPARLTIRILNDHGARAEPEDCFHVVYVGDIEKSQLFNYFQKIYSFKFKETK